MPPPAKPAIVSKILRFLNLPIKEFGGYFFLEDEDFFEGFIFTFCLVDIKISRNKMSVNRAGG